MSVTISTGSYNGYSTNVTLYIPTGHTIPYNNVSATTESLGVKILPFNYSGSSDIFEYGVFSCEMTGFSPSKICTTSLLTTPDGDGNKYKTIKIGNQIWMSENLKTTKFQDGTPLSNTSEVDNATWSAATASNKYWALVNGTTANTQTYGLVYNQFAVTGSTTGATASNNLCPSGWHVPTDAEFATLNTFLGTATAGTQMKSTTLWSSSGNGTNSSGFNLVAPGGRGSDGNPSIQFNISGYLWPTSSGGIYWRCDFNNSNFLQLTINSSLFGFSVRCLKN
jgi:uncharacterized protein (TIGR02145 family)